MSKQIHIVCINCGKKNDKKKKFAFGSWMGNCDMCGAKDVQCADAAHDFGIYSSEKARIRDKVQDMI